MLANDLNARDATLMRLQDIGEQLARIRENFPEFCAQNYDENWPKIIGLRNIILHGYHDIDLQIIWDILEAQLPAFAAHINSINAED